MESLRPVHLVTLEYPPAVGGVGRMYEQLLQHLSRPAVVWAPLGGSRNNVVVRHASLLADSGWPRWRSTFRVLRRIAVEDPGAPVVIGQVLPLGIPAWLYSYASGAQYSVIVHGMDVAAPLKVRRRAWVLKRIFSRAHVIFAANRHVAQLVTGLAPSARVQIVYPSPYLAPRAASSDERAKTRERLGVAPDGVLVLTLARLVKRKGHELMIKAVEQAVMSNPGITYVIAGDGPERQALRRRIETSSARNHVRLLGRCSDDEARHLLSAADIFMMTPSAGRDGDIEGVGIVYLEAAMFGLAIIASRTGGVPEALDDGRVGMLVAEGDLAGIVRALTTLSKDSALRQQLGARAKAYVSSVFDASKQAQVLSEAL